MKNYIKNLRLRKVGVGVIAGSSIVAPFKAMAGVPVVDAAANTLAIQANVMLGAVLELLVMIYMSLVAITPTGPGVAPTLHKISATLSSGQFIDTQSAIENNSLDKALASEVDLARKVAEIAPSQVKCEQVASKNAAPGGGGGGGNSKNVAAGVQVELDVQRESIQNTSTQIQRVLDPTEYTLVAASTDGAGKAKLEKKDKKTATPGSPSVSQRGAQGFCSASDLVLINAKGEKSARGAFGCTAVGTMPNADANLASVTKPALNLGNLKAKASPYTYNRGRFAPPVTENEFSAASNAISNAFASFAPPALTKAMEETSTGQEYLARVKVYSSRASAASAAATSITGSYSPAVLNASQAERWKDAEAVYKKVYGADFQGFPENPSEMEWLNYLVIKHNFDSDNRSKVGKMTPEELQLEQYDLMATQLLMMQKLIDRTNDNTIINAAILAQMMNPITPEDLTNLSGSIGR